MAEWKAQFDLNQLGVASRFSFLVLSGPSKTGKTQFAKSLFGTGATLVLGCQNAEPNVRRFSRATYKAVVFDEITPQCVARNKVLFQAGVEGVDCAQSRTSIYSYWRFLYAAPLILCTNEWLEDLPARELEENKKAWDWIRANQFHVHVDRSVCEA